MPADSFVRAAEVIDVHDGDTVTVMADLGFSTWYMTSIRLLGIDTPEIRGQERPWGMLSREHLLGIVQSMPKGKFGHKVWLKSVEPDKFGGRWLGYLYLSASDDYTVNERMVEDGFARLYKGDKKSLYPLGTLAVQPLGASGQPLPLPEGYEA